MGYWAQQALQCLDRERMRSRLYDIPASTALLAEDECNNNNLFFLKENTQLCRVQVANESDMSLICVLNSTHSALKPLTCRILICFTMVLFPDSPAPSKTHQKYTRILNKNVTRANTYRCGGFFFFFFQKQAIFFFFFSIERHRSFHHYPPPWHIIASAVKRGYVFGKRKGGGITVSLHFQDRHHISKKGSLTQ